MHVAERGDDAPTPLTGLAAFCAFQRAIGERCAWGPVVADAELIRRFDG